MKTMKRRGVLFIFALLFFASSLPQQGIARSGPTGFADLAEKLLPSVVNISTTQTISPTEDLRDFPDMQFPPGSPFEDFFKEFREKQGEMFQGEKLRKRKATSLGSGFIIDPSGYIVTNNHVIQDADEITVILNDDTNLPAKLVGRDKKTDLALLKVETTKQLKAVNWGDSDAIRVGDWIMAIGNPFGLGGTVTTGIISARARDINSGPYDDYLQTDAPINRGNSGGPMFDMNGNVIGVNTAIFSPSGGSIGIGFAIPSTLAKNVIEQLKTSGRTKRGWLGVRIQNVTPEIADGLGIGKPRGALVSSVTPEGPAAKAKIESGDVIVRFDGKEVPEMHRLPRIVAETAVDKSVPVTVIRKGEEVTLQVKVGELEANDESEDKNDVEQQEEKETDKSDKIEELGMNVLPLTEALRKKYELPKESSGLIVMSVAQEGLAIDNGIIPGDVVAEAAQQPVKTAKELSEIAKKAKKDGKPLLLLVERKGELRFVALKFAKEDKKEDKKEKEKK